MRLIFVTFAIAVACVLPPKSFGQGAPELDVREFARSLHDVTYSEMSSVLDSRAVPDLVDMLDSESEQMNWPAAATMLGVIGTDQAAEALIAFIEQSHEGEFSQFMHDRRRVSITSLGYVVYETGNERALDYLVDGLNPQVWRQRDVQGIGPSWSTQDAYDQQLSTYAIFGLALSGHPVAGIALDNLKGQSEGRQDSRLISVLDTWLEVHALVDEKGLNGMYEHFEDQRKIEAERQREEIRQRHPDRYWEEP